MAAKASVELSLLNAGINRFVDEAGPHQIVDGLNVWKRRGNLARRPAFTSVATGAPYLLPAGACRVVHEYPLNATFTDVTNRVVDIPYDQLGGPAGRLWIGCITPFDGFEWKHVNNTFVPDDYDDNFQIDLWYPRGGTTDLHINGVVDSTKAAVRRSDTNVYHGTLTRDGRVSWNKTAFANQLFFNVNGGVPGPLSGNTDACYWVIVDIARYTTRRGDASSNIRVPLSNGNFVLDARGVRAFLLNPINGLFPTHTSGRKPVMVVGSDFQVKRGHALGGGLGFISTRGEETEIARLVEDEGAGVNGTYNAPGWSGVAFARGTAGVLTKDDQNYQWAAALAAPTGNNVGQFDGAILGAATPSAIQTDATHINVAVATVSLADNLENLRLRVVAQPGIGPAVGEEREIYQSLVSGQIHVHDNFSALFNGTETLEVRRPGAMLRTLEGGRDYEIDTNTAHTATPVASARPYQAAMIDNNQAVNFEISRECWWSLYPGKRWCAAFDSVTSALILTNGKNGLLEYRDGRLRKLQAMWDPTDGIAGCALVQQWRGIIRDIAVELADPSIEQGSQLRRTPPDGEFVIEYKARLVVAGGNRVRWSAPSIFNAIWPSVYSTSIRGAEAGPITGMSVIADRICVFTASSIYMGSIPNDRGEISFNSVVEGTGFSSHFACCKAPLGGSDVLIGVNADGIGAFNGVNYMTILDDWKRVLPRGVNTNQLEHAAMAYWRSENMVVVAVAQAGSTVNDRIVLIDLVKKEFWVWSTQGVYNPTWGTLDNPVTAIATQYDESGKEYLYFGHADGHISVLQDALYDSPGGTITGYARAKYIGFEGRTCGFTNVLVRAQAIGTTPTLYMYARMNRSDRNVSAPSVALAGVPYDAVFDTTLWDDGSLWAGDVFRTYRYNLPNGTAVGEHFDFEVRSDYPFVYGGATLEFTPRGRRGY